MSCKCSWCKECSASRKLAMVEELGERPVRRGSNHSAYPKGRKQRLDQLNQAYKDFWSTFESDERDKADAFNCKWKDQGHKHGPWMCFHNWKSGWLESSRKKYLKALKACVDAGDVPPPSWY